MFVEKNLKYWDEETKEIREISPKDFEEKIRNLMEMLKKCADKMKKVGRYDLKSLEVSLSLRAGIFVFTSQGSIKLRYEI
ncbi:MAG: hypothetical protein JSV20_05535 [Candidatus Bathyarchaeota archaeon]|nr:MAG: hypothetical protein JSV20_05535 [Candidatus Bathyarchaeota archaeon]